MGQGTLPQTPFLMLSCGLCSSAPRIPWALVLEKADTVAGEGAGASFLILTLKEQGCIPPLPIARDWAPGRRHRVLRRRTGSLEAAWSLITNRPAL